MDTKEKNLNQYRRTSIETASPGELVIMLYSGAIKFMHQAKKCIAEKDVEGANRYIIKTENIVSELMSTLNMDVGGDISKNLYNLYEFFTWRLIQANVKKDPAILDEVIRMFSELKETWSVVVTKSKLAEKFKKNKAPAASFSRNTTPPPAPPAKPAPAATIAAPPQAPVAQKAKPQAPNTPPAQASSAPAEQRKPTHIHSKKLNTYAQISRIPIPKKDKDDKNDKPPPRLGVNIAI